jgi:hypothetical protein
LVLDIEEGCTQKAGEEEHIVGLEVGEEEHIVELEVGEEEHIVGLEVTGNKWL